jgi:hypothetical protein
MGLNEEVVIGPVLMILADCDSGYAVVHIEITTLILARLNASDVMKSIMSTTGKEISRRSEDGTQFIIQFSC